MTQEPKKIESRIKKALKLQDTYTPALDMSIYVCACSYCVMCEAFSEIDDNGVTLLELTREEHEKRNPNPATRAFLDAAEVTRKNLRELGLTLSTLVASDDDAVSDLIDEVNSVEE